MVLEFGLLKTGLFAESELIGDGLGSDTQQTVVTQVNINPNYPKILVNDDVAVNTVSETEVTLKTYSGLVFKTKNAYRITVFARKFGTGSGSTVTLRIKVSDGTSVTQLISRTSTSLSGTHEFVVDGSFSQLTSTSTNAVIGGFSAAGTAFETYSFESFAKNLTDLIIYNTLNTILITGFRTIGGGASAQITICRVLVEELPEVEVLV